MKYYRYGHVEPKKFKVGDIVERGQLIALNGTGNGQWSAHIHFDILTYKPVKFTEFCVGKSKDWVKAHYADPRGLEKIVLPTHDHLGYGWLEDAQYVGGHAFHPGLDLNGKGSGNADINDPVYSACYGKVVYIHIGMELNSGWGDMIVIEEMEKIIEVIPEKIEEVKVEEKIPEEIKIPVEESKEVEIIKSDENKENVCKAIPVDLKFIIDKIIGLFNKFLR